MEFPDTIVDMADQIEELLTRRVQQILPTKEALASLVKSRRIKLYQGFDPSSPNLHIGHLVGILQLKMFQDLGHEVIFLIGDFTGMIGDPTDKSAARPKLTHEQIMVNAKTYQDQVGRILRFDGDNPAKMLFNYDWLSKISFADMIEIASNLTVQQLLERDMYQERLQANRPIFLHEFFYPLAQGYDSVAMDVDLEVGGNDQMFNLMVGRQLMKSIKNKEKLCLTTKLLTDAEGRKIGKTTGNAINLFGEAGDLYGAVMSQPDNAIVPMLELATMVPWEEIESIKTQAAADPMNTKKRLAYEIVKLCQGETKANEAQQYFESMFQKKNHQTAIETLKISKSDFMPLEIMELGNLGSSNSDRKRMMREGAFQVNDQKITDPAASLTLSNGDIIKFGKHTFKKIQME